MALIVEELRQAGLVDSSPSPHLTDKGRDWLAALNNADTTMVIEDAAEDLVLSTSGLFR